MEEGVRDLAEVLAPVEDELVHVPQLEEGYCRRLLPVCFVPWNIDLAVFSTSGRCTFAEFVGLARLEAS